MEVIDKTTENLTKSNINKPQIAEKDPMLNVPEIKFFQADDVSIPADRYNLVYLIVLLHGIGKLFFISTFVFRVVL